jgi:hypothetical protein
MIRCNQESMKNLTGEGSVTAKVEAAVSLVGIGEELE